MSSSTTTSGRMELPAAPFSAGHAALQLSVWPWASQRWPTHRTRAHKTSASGMRHRQSLRLFPLHHQPHRCPVLPLPCHLYPNHQCLHRHPPQHHPRCHHQPRHHPQLLHHPCRACLHRPRHYRHRHKVHHHRPCRHLPLPSPSQRSTRPCGMEAARAWPEQSPHIQLARIARADPGSLPPPASSFASLMTWLTRLDRGDHALRVSTYGAGPWQTAGQAQSSTIATLAHIRQLVVVSFSMHRLSQRAAATREMAHRWAKPARRLAVAMAASQGAARFARVQGVATADARRG